MLKSHFNKVTEKETPVQLFLRTPFTEHLQATATEHLQSGTTFIQIRQLWDIKPILQWMCVNKLDIKLGKKYSWNKIVKS